MEDEFVAELLRHDIGPLSKQYKFTKKDSVQFDSMVQDVFADGLCDEKPTYHDRMKTVDL